MFYFSFQSTSRGTFASDTSHHKRPFYLQLLIDISPAIVLTFAKTQFYNGQSKQGDFD